jgi:simple sugar transport system permease protein
VIGLRFERRHPLPRWQQALLPVLAVAAALALCAVLVVWAGADLATAYAALFTGALGSRFAILETLVKTAPLILTGLAVALAFRARFWNIGAEGQLYAGAIAATWLALGFPDAAPASCSRRSCSPAPGRGDSGPWCRASSRPASASTTS